MNEEVKEILDNTIEYLEGIDETRNTKILTINEANILLDYIINLQKENEELSQDNLEGCKKFMKYKQRIDKAIKFIKENASYDEEISSCCDDLLYSDCDKLIELLGGNE